MTMLAHNQTVPFWPEEKTAKYPSILPLLYKVEKIILIKIGLIMVSLKKRLLNK